MKQSVFYGILIFLCYMLQTTLFIGNSLFSAAPNFLLILAVTAGLLHGSRFGMIVGFFSGLAFDLYQGKMIGFYALLFVFAGFAAGLLWKVYFEQTVQVPAAVVLASDIVIGFIIYVVKFFLRGRIRFGGYFVTVIIPEAVTTALFAVLVYKIIYLFEKRFLTEEKRGKRRTWLKD